MNSKLLLSLLLIAFTLLVGCENNSNTSLPPASPVSSTALTKEKAQNTLNKWKTDKGTVEVIGIQEMPQQNAAVANLQVDINYKYKEKWPYARLPSDPEYTDKVYQYRGNGIATFIHFNDGKWILKEVQTGQAFVNDFRWREINLTVE